jgi:hypothetical protein
MRQEVTEVDDRDHDSSLLTVNGDWRDWHR